MAWIITSFVIYLIGIITIVAKYGILVDISHTYTEIKTKLGKRLFRVWFPLFLMPAATVPEGDELIVFRLGCLFICGVAFFPEFYSKISGKLHVVFALGGILMITYSVLFEFGFGWWGLLSLFYVVPAVLLETGKIKIKNKTWYTENGAYFLAVIALYFYIKLNR